MNRLRKDDPERIVGTVEPLPKISKAEFEIMRALWLNDIRRKVRREMGIEQEPERPEEEYSN